MIEHVPDVLTTAPGVRAARTSTSRREYVDLLVNGVPLRVLLRSGGVPVLVTDSGYVPTVELRRLLGELPSPLQDGRVPLLVCGECGDLGCGADTAVVEHGATTVTWRDFAFQYDYAPLDDELMAPGIGPFVFDRRAYRAALTALLPLHDADG